MAYLYLFDTWDNRECLYSRIEYYKIGISEDYEKRLKQIQSCNPFHISLSAYIYFETIEQARNMEKELHDKFDSKRINGEWFQLDFNDLELIYKYIRNRNDAGDNESLLQGGQLWNEYHKLELAGVIKL